MDDQDHHVGGQAGSWEGRDCSGGNRDISLEGQDHCGGDLDSSYEEQEHRVGDRDSCWCSLDRNRDGRNLESAETFPWDYSF
jgi:hypothetical protein